jgi:C4-dicarboxylate transporter
MVTNKEFKLLQLSNIRNGEDLFYYLWLVLFFPIVDMILFSIPLYFSLKTKKTLIFLIGIIAILLIEYFAYTYFTSQKLINRDAFLKVIINAFLLTLFFYKTIRLKFTEA